MLDSNYSLKNIGRTLFVDSVYGVDATARPFAFDQPYLTLAAAKAVAVSGNTIHVRPGAYTITASLAKADVNWHFEAGATVVYESTDPVAATGIWDDGGEVMAFAVTGCGTFSRVLTSNSGAKESYCVSVSGAGSNVDIECLDLSTNDVGNLDRTIWQSSGTLRVRCRDILAPSNTGVYWSNGLMEVVGRVNYSVTNGVYSNVTLAPAGDAHVRFVEYVTSGYAVYSAGSQSTAAIWIRGDTYRGSVQAVLLNGSERVYIEAQKIFGQVNNAGTGLLYIRADKLTGVDPGVSLVDQLGAGTSWIAVNDWDGVGCVTNVFNVQAGTLNLLGGQLHGDASTLGLIIDGGTAYLNGVVLDTSLNSLTNPITKSGGTLTLHDCVLVAQATRNSIEAATAQTVTVKGTLTTNRPNHANVTLVGGVAVIGNAVTLLQDATLVAGSLPVLSVKAGPGSSVNTQTQQWLDSGGTVQGYVTAGNMLFFTTGFAAGGAGGGRKWQLDGPSSAEKFISTGTISWSSTTGIGGPYDLELAREAASILSISDAAATGNPGIAFRAKSSTTSNRVRARIATVAVDNTDASRKYKVILSVADTAEHAAITMEADGARATTYVPAGSGTGNARVGGCIFDHFASVGNVDTGEDDLYSDSVPALTLSVNGDKLQAEYGGSFVSSGTATRQLKVHFGGTAIFDSGALTLSLSSGWTIYVAIIRVSATVVRYMVSMATQGAALAAYTSVGELTGLTLSNANTLKITGEAAGAGAATDDIVAKLGTISWCPAA